MDLSNENNSFGNNSMKQFCYYSRTYKKFDIFGILVSEDLYRHLLGYDTTDLMTQTVHLSDNTVLHPGRSK